MLTEHKMRLGFAIVNSVTYALLVARTCAVAQPGRLARCVGGVERDLQVRRAAGRRVFPSPAR